MIPAVIGLASGTILLLSRGDESPPVALPASHDLTVPLPAVTRKQWIEFVKTAACASPRTVNPNFRLGTFGFTVRRLCDLGAMKHPRAIWHQGRRVWDGDWVKPHSLKDFQADSMGQYDLFVRSIGNYAKNTAVFDQVGQQAAGLIITLSGALMGAHRAGVSGFRSWISDSRIREKFSDTTACIRKANDIF